MKPQMNTDERRWNHLKGSEEMGALSVFICVHLWLHTGV